MTQPGIFAVDAKIASLTVKRIEIKLDDLLAKQARHEPEIEYEYVTLNVNLLLNELNKLFLKKA